MAELTIFEIFYSLSKLVLLMFNSTSSTFGWKNKFFDTSNQPLYVKELLNEKSNLFT